MTTKNYCPGCGGSGKDYNWVAPKEWKGGSWEHYVQKNKPKPVPPKPKPLFAELLANTHVRSIHLPKRIDREMLMKEAFRRLGIADRKDLFFPAIDGKNPPVKNTSGMRPGNWGCALSKSAIMKEAVELKKPLLLLEDDVVINEQIHPILDACLAELPADWKVLYLGFVALKPHESMPTHGQPIRDRKGKWFEVLANPNLNHALLIRDLDCLKELSAILADPETYKRDEGRFTSDYTVAQYFAHKGIPMYGVVPEVAKQCDTYSDNENKVINRRAVFQSLPPQALNRKWNITGTTQYPIEWGGAENLPDGYVAAKIHPPFDLTLTLDTKSDVQLLYLATSRVKDGEKITVTMFGMEKIEFDPAVPKTMTLEPGDYTLTCHPDGETWRWKHVAIAIKE